MSSLSLSIFSGGGGEGISWGRGTKLARVSNQKNSQVSKKLVQGVQFFWNPEKVPQTFNWGWDILGNTNPAEHFIESLQ